MGVLACSRVIMKTALALAVAMFLVASASAHGHWNKNNNNKNNNNKNNHNKNRGGKREERCGVQQYTVSEKTYKQECHEDNETKCATSYENKCSTVTEVTTKYEQVCATSYVESCGTVTECSDWPIYSGDQGVSHCQPPRRPRGPRLRSRLWSRPWSALWSLHSSHQRMCRGACPQKSVH